MRRLLLETDPAKSVKLPEITSCNMCDFQGLSALSAVDINGFDWAFTGSSISDPRVCDVCEQLVTPLTVSWGTCLSVR